MPSMPWSGGRLPARIGQQLLPTIAKGTPMDDHPTAADLQRIPLLAGLSPDLLAILAMRFDIEEFGVGRNIVTEGDAGYAFYVIDAGKATVTREGEALRMLGGGDFFGEIAILAEGRRTATVTAVEPVVAWVMFGTSFRALEIDRPDVANALQEAMRDRLATG